MIYLNQPVSEEFVVFRVLKRSLLRLFSISLNLCIFNICLVNAQNAPPSSSTTTIPHAAVLKQNTPTRYQVKLIEPVKYCHIGRLSHNLEFSPTAPNAYCVGETYYEGAQHRFGRLNLFYSEIPNIIDQLPRETTMISAIKKSNLWNKIEKRGPCPKRDIPVMQFRSDWYADEGGYDTTKNQLTAAAYLELQKTPTTPVSLDLLHVQKPETLKNVKYHRRKQVQITEPIIIQVNYPLTVPFTSVTLELHYEGGSRKPMPHYERIKVNLRPGEQQTIHVASTLQKSKKQYRSTWVFYSVKLRGMIGSCQLH